MPIWDYISSYALTIHTITTTTALKKVETKHIEAISSFTVHTKGTQKVPTSSEYTLSVGGLMFVLCRFSSLLSLFFLSLTFSSTLSCPIFLFFVNTSIWYMSSCFFFFRSCYNLSFQHRHRKSSCMHVNEYQWIFNCSGPFRIC